MCSWSETSLVFFFMVIHYEVLKAKAFNNNFMVGFYGGGEYFTKRTQSRDGCYVKQGWREHSTKN